MEREKEREGGMNRWRERLFRNIKPVVDRNEGEKRREREVNQRRVGNR